MIEVFKTNVEDPKDAECLIQLIIANFYGYQVNFDLEDCDRIMRVMCEQKTMDVDRLIFLLNDSGFKAEILQDNLVADCPFRLRI
jgi:hypothetical protein